jgi:thiol-disulfide isomerase/thioredoxin
MPNRRLTLTAALLIAASAASVTVGQTDATTAPAKQPEAAKAKKLSVGDKAPPLSIEKWVKGDEVTGFEKGKVYVVEFWATWCGPCVASMPHLSALQKEYKDRVTIIGVTKVDPNNSLDQVQTMVKDKGDGMGYTVAWDKDKETSNAYMKAAGQNGIPCSFVVDGTGTVAYIGHPMWLDIPLEKISKGTWDAKTGMDEIKTAEQKLSDVYENMQTDPKAALKALSAFEKEYPSAATMFGDLKYTLMVKAGDPKASEVGREMVAKAIKANDSMKLNEIAWGIVDPEAKIEKPDLDLAMTAATKAVEITKEKDGAILDTLAWVHFHKGDTAKAIEIEKKAIAAAPAGMKDQLEESLKKFEAKK